MKNIDLNINIDIKYIKPHHLNWPREELIMYFLVSLVGLLIDLGIFSLAARIAGLSWELAAVFGFAAGAITVWWLSINFVFKNRALRQAPIVEFFGFLAIGMVGLGVTEVVLWLGIELLHIQPEFSKIGAAGITFIFNFAFRKWLLFRKTNRKFLLQQDQT